MREQSQINQNESTLVQSPYKKMLTRVIESIVYKLLPGLSIVKPGDEINIDGIGPGLKGIYYVEEVKHEYSSTGYKQSFKLSRSSTDSEPEGMNKK